MISFYDKKSVANWTANIDLWSPVRAGPCSEWRGRSLMVCEFILGRANFELVHHRPVAGSGQTANWFTTLLSREGIFTNNFQASNTLHFYIAVQL